MKKVLALLALTTSFAAVAAPVAGHAGKAPHKGANPAVAKTQGKAFKARLRKVNPLPTTHRKLWKRRLPQSHPHHNKPCPQQKLHRKHLRPINLR